MAEDGFQNDANRGESDGIPEALQLLQLDRGGRNDNRRWRYAARELASLPYVGAGMWKQIGPAPLIVGGQQVFQGIGPDSGEVVDIAVDPRGDRRTLYAAAGNGGVWKSVDAGAGWAPLTDQLAALAVGAIAIDPGDPETLYVGTGNLFDGSAGMPKAAGLFKSVDGGQSWSRLVSPASRPPQPITAATNVTGGIRLTVAGHGYSTLDRVCVIGLPLRDLTANESDAVRIDDNTLRITGQLASAYAGNGAQLFDARQPPFLSDKGVVRMVCPAPGALLVAAQTGLYYSRDGGLNFGANTPSYDDGKPVRTGLISALEVDTGWNRTVAVADASVASPIVITAPGHGFADGDRVYVGGVDNNTAANGGWLVDRVDDDHFSLRGSTGVGGASANGFAIGPAHPVTRQVTGATNPALPQPVVITSAGHGFVTGDVVAVSGVQGNTGANGSWPIRVLSPDTFALVGCHGNAAYVAGGIVDGPNHPGPLPITAAVNQGGGVNATVANHGLVNGDRVSVTGLPGIAAPGNSAAVHVVDANTVRLAGLTMTGAYGGAGATLAGPATSWNTAYFVSAGRVFTGAALNPDRGLFRLTITSQTGELVSSDNLLAHSGGVSGAFGRAVIAQSVLPRSRTLYVAVQDREDAAAVFIGLFRSDDFGGTWTARPALANRVVLDGSGQSNYDLTLGVDPRNPNIIYGALQQLWRSDDGGTTFPIVRPLTRGGMDDLGGFGLSPSTTLVHWDHHELLFQPATHWEWSGGQPPAFVPLYVGTDGGVAIGTTLPGPPPTMQFQALNEGFATSLIRDLDIAHGVGTTGATFAGMQDTGTAGRRAGDAAAAWTEGIDGDGGDVAVDPFDPDIVFGFDNGSLIRSTNGGLTWMSAGLPARPLVVSVFNENPVRVLTTGHAFRNGDTVTISGVTGGGGIANGAHIIDVVNKNEFTLRGVNGSAAAAFGAGPVVTGDRYLGQASIVAVTATNPIEIETATAHGCANGNKVRIDGVLGLIAANNSVTTPSWTVTVLTPTRVQLNGADGTGAPAYVPNTGRLRGPNVNAQIPVFRAENTSPIVINALAHGFVSGDVVTVAGVLGNTNANVANQQIAVLDTNSFELVGVNGNASFTGGPRVSGPSVGRGLGGAAYRAHVALVPNAGAAATTVYVSEDRVLFRSDDGGIRFTQVNGFADPVTALYAPADARLWVGTAGNRSNPFRQGRVLFSRNKGAHFLAAADNFVSDIGAQGAIGSIIEDPNVADGSRVAVVVAGYSATVASRRTRHCFVTTTGGISVGGAPAWHELGGPYDAATGNFPDLPVLSVAFQLDAAAAASALLVASDLGVLRQRAGSQTWERVGPNLPAISCQTILIDNTVGKEVTRVGTYGRSAWEFVTPPGAALYVEADLGFGEQQVGVAISRPMVLHSVGAAQLTVSAISGTTGDVSVTSDTGAALAFPLALAGGEHRALTVTFTPSVTGDRSTTLGVASDDPSQPSVPIKVTAVGVAAGRPRLAVRGFLEFGNVAVGVPGHTQLEIRNVGNAPLVVDHVDLDPTGSPLFTFPVAPALPLTIAPGAASTLDVQLAPAANGPLRGAILVTGSGQGQVVNLRGTGVTNAAGLVAALMNLLGVADPPDVLV